VTWALQQPTTGFFILTNTRSLSESDAADLNREVVDALRQAADSEARLGRGEVRWAHPARQSCPDHAQRHPRRRPGPRPLEILTGLRDRQPVVVDTAADADQLVVVLALLRAEAAGKNFIYRIGPSFVRAR
jgi:hypothetical protein